FVGDRFPMSERENPPVTNWARGSSHVMGLYATISFDSGGNAYGEPNAGSDSVVFTHTIIMVLVPYVMTNHYENVRLAMWNLRTTPILTYVSTGPGIGKYRASGYFAGREFWRPWLGEEG